MDTGISGEIDAGCKSHGLCVSGPSPAGFRDDRARGERTATHCPLNPRKNTHVISVLAYRHARSSRRMDPAAALECDAIVPARGRNRAWPHEHERGVDVGLPAAPLCDWVSPSTLHYKADSNTQYLDRKDHRSMPSDQDIRSEVLSMPVPEVHHQRKAAERQGKSNVHVSD